MALVYLETFGAAPVPVPVGRKRLQRLARHWHYVMRSRERWISDAALRAVIELRAATHLGEIGIPRQALENFAAQGVVQVSMAEQQPLAPAASGPSPMSAEDSGWESRLIPWEYLLTAATRKFRNGPLVVVRCLWPGAGNALPCRAIPGDKAKGAFIESAPGRLHGLYNFDIEFRVLESHLRDQVAWKRVVNPSLGGIAQELSAQDPDIVHVTGVDAFQGTKLLDTGGNVAASSIKDGMFLRDSDWNEVLVDAYPLTTALAAGSLRPSMVSFNLYNSSARLAAFAVGAGAGAAIGFQDYIDDRVAEIFFANFYWKWRINGWNVLTAFRNAMSEIDQYRDKVCGTGVVLWSAQSLLTGDQKNDRVIAQTREVPAQITDWVEAEVAPYPKLNYSVLHNSYKPLFDRFSIYKFEPHTLRDVEVNVELQVGGERFPYQRSFVMQHHVLDLSSEVRVGLTSRLARSLRESVRTTLAVRVSHGNDVILATTYHVVLLPLDEWKDDNVNGIWLPSFVLPRDPAVLEVVICAQRYLMALRDDAGAGFDGYQGLYDRQADAYPGDAPGGEFYGEDSEPVDAQVRAIWYALLYDHNISYINPPPVFTVSSQRLRTPTEVITGKRGTCIDLALLFAACLEFLDIKAVIFLLDGHAFPGYWSSERAREQVLIQPNPAPLSDASEDGETPLPDAEEEQEETSTFAQTCSWEFEKSRYEEVIGAIRDGVLVPVETTFLTNRGSFSEAVRQGEQNLESMTEFNSMLDIALARLSDVTPLPWGKD